MLKAFIMIAFFGSLLIGANALAHNFTKEFSMNLEVINKYVKITLTMNKKLPDYYKNMYMGVGFGAKDESWADMMVISNKESVFKVHDLYGQGEEYDGSITNKDDTKFSYKSVAGVMNVYMKGQDTPVDNLVWDANKTDKIKGLNRYDPKNDFIVGQFTRLLKSGDKVADLTLKEDVEYNMFWFYGEMDGDKMLWSGRKDHRVGTQVIPIEQAFGSTMSMLGAAIGSLAILFGLF